MLNKSFIVLLTGIFSIVAIAFVEDAYSRNNKKFGAYKQVIETRYHHLGDDYMQHFIDPEPEGTLWENNFYIRKWVINHFEIAFVKFLAKHLDSADLYVNGNQIRLLQAKVPTRQNYFIYIVPIPFDILKKGKNVISFEPYLYHDGNWDDFEFGEVEIRFQ